MESTKPKKFVTKVDVTELRQRKIKQYLLKSLNDPDPLQANLGVVASDLMGVALQFKQAIDEELTDESERLKRIERILPTLDMYLKINRQVDRYIQLDRRLISVQHEGRTETQQ